jgi:endonuclease/exonuclease/phosphatase family metal-dependent hydrolase
VEDQAAHSGDIRVAFWNLQNLFDVDTSPIATDLEFTPAFGWDRNALEIKIGNLARVIGLMFDGQGPDLLGLCEIENERVAEQLLKLIGRSDYQLAHVAHPDVQGINTSLVYSNRVFDCDIKNTRGHLIDKRFPTRDIFEVHLKIRQNNSELVVLVNHWPSRRPDRYTTEPFRIAVASQCGRIINDLLKLHRREYLALNDNDVSVFQLNQAWDRNVLVMGDFNDEPWNRSVLESLNACFSVERLDESIRMVRGSLPSWRSYNERRSALFNPMPSLMTSPDQGTHYDANGTRTMSMRDQFMLSRGLYFGLGGLRAREATSGVPKVGIFRPDVMTTHNDKPREFNRHEHTGYSDHFPITMTLQQVSGE